MISEEKSKKHGNLVKPKQGSFARREVALYGTTCDEVRILVHRVRSLFPGYDIAYADADHHPEVAFFGTTLQDCGHSIQLTSSPATNPFQRRTLLAQSDAVIVNGNHFSASTQIIVCNPEKENSLRKRADQLTNVIALLLLPGQSDVPSYVYECLPNDIDVAIIKSDDDQAMHYFLVEKLLYRPQLNALILAGGKSTRMGTDKFQLDHHGVAQYVFLHQMMEEVGIEPWISCRAEQADFFAAQDMKVIIDKLHDIGPMSGLLSAFMSDPDAAWLVVACDLPLADRALIQELISHRNHSNIATAFHNNTDGLPEPLMAIWEPKSYSLLLQFIAQGYSCPRKVLINSNAHIVECSKPQKLTNVNTREELLTLRAAIEQGGAI